MKVHIAKAHAANDKSVDKMQNFKDTLADEAVKVAKWTEQQKHRPTIFCKGNPLDNVFKFVYLGSIFAADGKQLYDITARIAMANKRCGQLSHIFSSSCIGPRLKLRLYIVAVCSLLTYGCESWALTDKVMRKINGANRRMLARVTAHTHNQTYPCYELGLKI